MQHNKRERVYAQVLFNYAVLTVNKVSVVLRKSKKKRKILLLVANAWDLF